MKAKLIHTALTAILVASLVFITIQKSSSGEYDPWVDMNDDGAIDIFDAITLANAFGTFGTPLNKTAMLLEIQANVNILNKTIIARIPERGIVSIPAAEFVHRNDYWTHTSWEILFGLEIVNWNVSRSAWFFAPVQLPNGVTIVRLTTHWRDSAAGDNVYCTLWRHKQLGPLNEMATAHSTGSPGLGSSANTTISYATIDNTYQYYLWVELPPYPGQPTSQFGFLYAVLEYDYPA